MKKSIKELLTEYFEYLDDRINKGEISSFSSLEVMALECFVEWCDEKPVTREEVLR